MSATDPIHDCGRRSPVTGFIIILATALALHLPGVIWPMLVQDDFQHLAQSWTWKEASANLWVPANEHSMPLGRLSTWLLVCSAGRITNIPWVFALQGPMAVLAGMVLTYLFVRRETDNPWRGLAAMALFGVTTHYQQAVCWFAASFAILALDTMLLALLAAQRWRQSGSYCQLALSAAWCALAPGWFGSGVLAGPLVTLYLLVEGRRDEGRDSTSEPRLLSRLAARLSPLAGTALSLAVSMPLNAKHILTLPRVEVPATVKETLNPLVGLGYTARSLVDDLLPGLVGFSGLALPLVAVAAGLVVLAGLATWCWINSEQRPLLLLGLGLILSNYFLVYTVRAYIDYEDMRSWAWTRYHLFAQLGLAMCLCAAPLPGWFDRPALARITGACLLVILVLVQIPRYRVLGPDLQQVADLERIARVDELCQLHHIDVETARLALPPAAIAGCDKQVVNGRILIAWDFLRGSDDSRPITVEEARQLLDR